MSWNLIIFPVRTAHSSGLAPDCSEVHRIFSGSSQSTTCQHKASHSSQEVSVWNISAVENIGASLHPIIEGTLC